MKRPALSRGGRPSARSGEEQRRLTEPLHLLEDQEMRDRLHALASIVDFFALTLPAVMSRPTLHKIRAQEKPLFCSRETRAASRVVKTWQVLTKTKKSKRTPFRHVALGRFTPTGPGNATSAKPTSRKALPHPAPGLKRKLIMSNPNTGSFAATTRVRLTKESRWLAVNAKGGTALRSRP